MQILCHIYNQALLLEWQLGSIIFSNCNVIIYLPRDCLGHVHLRGVKDEKYFTSSRYTFLDRKTLLKIWLNS